MEMQSEFENKYSINDLLIGHVSVVGIYKGIVSEDFITSNTFTYFQEAGVRKEQQTEDASKIIKSNTHDAPRSAPAKTGDAKYHFIDTLAIIQDVTFNLESHHLETSLVESSRHLAKQTMEELNESFRFVYLPQSK